MSMYYCVLHQEVQVQQVKSMLSRCPSQLTGLTPRVDEGSPCPYNFKI